MNESRRMLQQLLRQPIQRFADGGPTVLFGPPPKEEDTVAPAGATIIQGPTISAASAPASTPASGSTITQGPAPTYATRQQIEDIYRNTLGRRGEQAGLDWWTSTAQQANLSPEQLRAEIAKSQEFQQWSPYDIDKSGGISEAERRAAINQVYQNIFAREGEAAGLDYWMQSGLTPQEMQKHFQESAEWGTLSPFDVNVDLRLSPAERAAYEASLLKKPVELPKAREAMEMPDAPKPIELPKVEVRGVPEVKPAEIDTEFRESAARTFDPVTQSFQYTAPAKLSPATGAGMTWVPPTVTSRARQLLNVAFTAGQGGYDPTTGTLYQPAMSASQRYGTDRTRQLGALQQAVSQAGFQPSSSGMIRLQNQLRAGGFRKEDGTIDTAALQAAVAALKPTTQAGPPAPASGPASTGSGLLDQAARAITSDQSNVPEAFRTLDPIRFSGN